MSSEPGVRRRITSAHVLSMIAIVLAVGGGTFAIAALKKNSVGKKQLKKNAVVTKKIKNAAVTAPKLGADSVTSPALGDGSVLEGALADGAVSTPKLADGSVSTSKLADGSVSSAKLSPDEPNHVVGTSGEPQFGTGGDGDCVWSSEVLPGGVSIAPVSFYRSNNGRVYIAGVLRSQNQGGGDGLCDNNNNAEAFQDGLAFTLPPGYRPDKPIFYFVQGGAGIAQLFIGGDEDTPISGATLAAGAVTVAPVLTDVFTLEGFNFRAAG